jgi:hypothetical protein
MEEMVVEARRGHEGLGVNSEVLNAIIAHKKIRC